MDGQAHSARIPFVHRDAIPPRDTVNSQESASVNLDIKEIIVNSVSYSQDVNMVLVKQDTSVFVMKVTMEYSVTSRCVPRGVVWIMASAGSLIPVRVNLDGQVPTVQNVFPARVASSAPAKIPTNASVTQNIKAIYVTSLSVLRDVTQRMVNVKNLGSVHARLDGKETIVQSAWHIQVV